MKQRLWLQIIAIIMLGVQGMYDLTPCYAALISPQPQKPAAPVVILERHTNYCRCRMCAGDKKCCCRPTNNAVESCTLTAACDTHNEALFTRLTVFRAIPPVFTLIELPQISETVLFPTLTEFAPSLASQPPTQPPRLS